MISSMIWMLPRPCSGRFMPSGHFVVGAYEMLLGLLLASNSWLLYGRRIVL